MFGIHHANRLTTACLLRTLSTGPGRVATRAATNDRDTFGTLSESGKRQLDVRYADENLPNDPDGYDRIEFDIEARKNAYYYKYEITQFARQGAPGLRRALELFQEMKSRANLEPTVDNFSVLIYGCARAGYTKRAFELYEESLKYLTKPSHSTVTCLINSCAESPFPEYGIQRLQWFLPHVKASYNRPLNEIHYNCAIKAFGKLGQLEEASKLVQEMIDEGLTPSVTTFNMLLIGCASNKEAGCSIALRVFKRLKMYNCQPNVPTYRILLRCIRDCGMGSPELIEETLKELPSVTSLDKRLEYQSRAAGSWRPAHRRKGGKFDSEFAWMPLTSDIGASIQKAIEEPKRAERESLVKVDKFTKASNPPAPRANQQHQNDLELLEPQTSNSFDNQRAELGHQLVTTPDNKYRSQLPNLLSDDHLDLVMRIRAIKFDNLERPVDRILLFGGIRGFLEAMMRDGLRPDNKTFSLILDCLEPTPANYLAYHELTSEMRIERDLLYYDLLIRHICGHCTDRRGRLELALEFVEKMHADNLRPNISTFESIAYGCHNWRTAEHLLRDIDKCGFVPSAVLVAKLFARALVTRNFHYLAKLIVYSQSIGFRPTKRQVDRIEEVRLQVHESILQQEKSRSATTEESEAKRFSDSYIECYDRFCPVFTRWLRDVELESEDHPWAQFKNDTSSKVDGFRDYEKHFRAMERAKWEALERDQDLGDLTEKGRRIVESQA